MTQIRKSQLEQLDCDYLKSLPSNQVHLRQFRPVVAGHRREFDHHHHVRLFEVVKRNRQHTVQKIDVGIYMDIHTHTHRLNTRYFRRYRMRQMNQAASERRCDPVALIMKHLAT